MSGKKRNRIETRQWQSAEVSTILNYMLDLKINGKDPCHPTANKYYQKVIDDLKIPCTPVQLKGKITNLKKKYSLAIQWTNKTGQGVDDGSILDHQRQICQFFDILDRIYGERKSFRVPYLYCNIQDSQPNPEKNAEINERDPNSDKNAEINERYEWDDIELIDGNDEVTDVENSETIPVDVQPNGNALCRNNKIEVIRIETISSNNVEESIEINDESNHGRIDSRKRTNSERIAEGNSEPVRKRIHPLIDHDYVNPALFGDDMSLEEEDDMIRRMLQEQDNDVIAENQAAGEAPNHQAAAEASNHQAAASNKSSTDDKVSRFRKSLSQLPQSKNGFKTSENTRNAASVIGEAMTNRSQMLSDRNQNEFDLRKQELQFQREKFDFEKEMRVKEMEFNHTLQMEKLKQEGRLAELRLKYEFDKRS